MESVIEEFFDEHIKLMRNIDAIVFGQIRMFHVSIVSTGNSREEAVDSIDPRVIDALKYTKVNKRSLSIEDWLIGTGKHNYPDSYSASWPIAYFEEAEITNGPFTMALVHKTCEVCKYKYKKEPSRRQQWYQDRYPHTVGYGIFGQEDKQLEVGCLTYSGPNDQTEASKLLNLDIYEKLEAARKSWSTHT